MAEPLVLDAGALLELLLGTAEGVSLGAVLRGHPLHAPDQAAVAVAGGLRWLAARGEIQQEQLQERLELLSRAPLEWHPAAPLLPGAQARSGLRLGDALTVELSQQMGAPLVTSDAGLATAWRNCWLVTAPRPQSARLS